MMNSSGVVPDKNSLLTIVTNSILEHSSTYIKELYNLMEKEFNLMNFAKKAEKNMDFLQGSEYSKFISLIQSNFVFKGI